MPTPSTPSPVKRPAFSISPATVVVAVAFIGVAVTQLVTRMDHPAFSWRGGEVTGAGATV